MNTIERPDVQSVLAQMRSMREAAQGALDPDDAGAGSAVAGAGHAVGSEVRFRHDAAHSHRSGELHTDGSDAICTDAFVRGDTDDLVKVMVPCRNRTWRFKAMTQVRNRLVTAYQDIMNMPI